MSLIGSPEWFFEKSQSNQMQEWKEQVESIREQFIKQFSPKQLSNMNGKQLLKKVFSDDLSSMTMTKWLMCSSEGRWFGSAGNYKYLGIVYQLKNGEWKYKEGAYSEELSVDEAAIKAEYVRDQLISCTNEIENIGVFTTVHDYLNLQNRLERVFFYKYPWVLKYYQMLYPQYFPGMYADKTIERAIHILGLRNHGISNRIMNAGEISLFIRRCDINNHVFGTIYGKQWGWETDFPPCPAASDNYRNCSKPVHSVNTEYYRIIT